MEHIFQPWLNCLRKNMRLSNLITQPHNANTQNIIKTTAHSKYIKKRQRLKRRPIEANQLCRYQLGLTVLMSV